MLHELAVMSGGEEVAAVGLRSCRGQLTGAGRGPSEGSQGLRQKEESWRQVRRTRELNKKGQRITYMQGSSSKRLGEGGSSRKAWQVLEQRFVTDTKGSGFEHCQVLDKG